MGIFQDTFETPKQSSFKAFSICMTVPLRHKNKIKMNYSIYPLIRTRKGPEFCSIY